MTATVRMYRLRRRGRAEWRWTITHRNGRIVGASTEGYRSRAACLANLCFVTRGKFYIPPLRPPRSSSYEWGFPSGFVR